MLRDREGVESMSAEVRVGLLGLGTVGTGVVSIISRHQEELRHQVGCPVTIKKVLGAR